MIRNLALAAACAGVALAPVCLPAANAYDSGLDPAFVIKDSRVTTSSGLVASTRTNGLYFTHNDGSDGNRLFAVDATGATRSVLTVSGATNVDWEDIASGPGNTLYVGDVGNDALNRSSIQVYKLTEPSSLRSTAKVSATRYAFSYPDGRRNSQAILVNPRTGQLYVVSKSGDSSAIYRAPSPSSLSTKKVNPLTRIAAAPAGVTGAAFAPDASEFVLGTATKTYAYTTFGGTPTVGTKPSLPDSQLLR